MTPLFIYIFITSSHYYNYYYYHPGLGVESKTITVKYMRATNECASEFWYRGIVRDYYILFCLQMSHTDDRILSVSFDGIYPIIIITYIIMDEMYIVYIYYIKHVVRVRRAYCYLWESSIIVRLLLLLLLLLFCYVTFSRCAHLSLGVWFV